jgi:hypothetical protein
MFWHAIKSAFFYLLLTEDHSVGETNGEIETSRHGQRERVRERERARERDGWCKRYPFVFLRNPDITFHFAFLFGLSARKS